MDSFNGPDSDIDRRLVLESSKCRRWRWQVESHGNQILQLDVMSAVSRRPGTWYIAFLDSLLLTPEGNRIARCLALRGESVMVVPLLRCIDDDQLYTVMVEQRSICDGGLHTGFPAGNVDDGKSFRVMVCQELMEETGLEISPNDQVELSEDVTLNSSLSDDLIYFSDFAETSPAHGWIPLTIAVAAFM